MIGNLPTEQTRSHWAVFLIILVILLFGFFWIEQKRAIESSPNPIPLAVQEPREQTPQEFTISDLEANAVNISIPSFEEVFPEEKVR